MNEVFREHYPEMQRALLSWFEKHGRDLPWRQTHSPYEVWISEMMLQQTQVKTMLPYFCRWMERFPDINSLAEASEEVILRNWEGLGYYSRALNIHRSAKILIREKGGELPCNHDELLKLPGIGRYSAGAILSIAFNKNCPVVDGNVERILSRLFNIATPVRNREAQDFLWNAIGELLPEGNAGRFNQAIMDLGATVCIPRNPLCHKCPWKHFCLSLSKGIVDQRPVTEKRKASVPIAVAVGVLEDDGRILIQKRPPVGLMANLWEFPGGKVALGEAPEEALVREFREELELRVRPRGKITLIRHNYTSFRVTLHAFRCDLEEPGQELVLRTAVEARWVKPGGLDNYAFPAANRKLIRILDAGKTRGDTFS